MELSSPCLHPLKINRGVTEPRQLEQPLSGRGYLALYAASTCIARAKSPQVLEREDAVMAIGPLDANCVASNFIQPANARRRL
jgi:hypothetical protein